MRIKLAWFLLLLVVVGAVVVVAQNDDEEAVMDFGDESGGGDAESDPTVLIQDKHVYVRPVVTGEHYFVETFEEETLIGGKWVKSEAKKDGVEDESIAKYDGAWSIESSRDSVLEGDKGLVLKSKAKHHAISSRLVKPFRFDTNAKSLVIQYEVKFQNVLECGGAYVKLLATDPKLTLEQFYDKTSFSIMFGPDKCGGESKYHFILRFRNPKTGVYEEHHAKKSELPDGLFADGKTHLYTLIIKPDNTYQMLIDNADINTGSLLSDLTPPINPPKEIVDPEDKKPVDWDDREQIADSEAVKPADWDETEPKLIDDAEAVKPDGWLDDEPEMIDDEMAIKPEDWDVETDGEWEAPKLENPKCKSAPGCGKWSPPQIANPKYKGKWSAPLVNNPRYQGIWEPRKIENPAYFEDEAPFKSLTSFEAVGLELWSMTDQIYFDNFIITDDETVANEFAQASWAIKKKLESQRSASQGSSDSVVGAFMKAAEDKPWLWAVVVLVVLLPIILIVVFCCGSSSKTSSAGAGDAKKTDAVQPDDNQAAQSSSNQQAEDEEEQEEEEEQQQQEEEEVTEAKKSPIKKRARKD